MVNRELVFQRVWNIVVCTMDPDCIRDRIREVLSESRKQDIFNEMRLDPADEAALEDIARDLDTMTDQLEFLKSSITGVAIKYRS